jgi:hypothetical protein
MTLLVFFGYFVIKLDINQIKYQSNRKTIDYDQLIDKFKVFFLKAYKVCDLIVGTFNFSNSYGHWKGLGIALSTLKILNHKDCHLKVCSQSRDAKNIGDQSRLFCFPLEVFT